MPLSQQGKESLFIRVTLQGDRVSQCRSRSKGKNQIDLAKKLIASHCLNAALAARKRIKDKRWTTNGAFNVSMPLSQQGKESI